MTSHRPTRVVMADQHTLLAESLGVVLELRRYEVRVVPLPPGPVLAEEVLPRLRALRPDVLLLEADLGPTRVGLALIAPMVELGTAVIVVTDSVDEAHWGECLLHGACTVLPKSASLATVVSAVRRAGDHEPVLDGTERDRLVDLHRSRPGQPTADRLLLATLSPQEGQVLRLMMTGRTVAEISRVRVVAEATVRTQVRSINAKLHVRSQLAAVAAARRAGWDCSDLTPDPRWSRCEQP